METVLLLPTESETIHEHQKAEVQAQEIQMSIRFDEVAFFQRFLNWSTLCCKEEDRYEIERLLKQLHVMQIHDLPALKRQMELLENRLHYSISAAWSEIEALRMRLLHFDQKLNRVKSKIFRRFSRFARVQIW